MTENDGSSVQADLLAVSGGWNPALELFSQSGGRVVWSDAVAGFVLGHAAQATRVAGALTGERDRAMAVAQGSAAGTAAAAATGSPRPTSIPPCPRKGPGEGTRRRTSWCRVETRTGSSSTRSGKPLWPASNEPSERA